jgi:hypothetical protein
MTQFRDLVLSSESFRRRARELNARLDEYAYDRIGKFSAESSIYRFTSKGGSGRMSQEEVFNLGNDTVEFVHELLWEAGTPVKGHNYRKYEGRLSDLTNVVFDTYSQEAGYGLSKTVSAGLHRSGRIRDIGKPQRGWLKVRVRPPTEKFDRLTSFNRVKGKGRYQPTRRDEDDIARQQRKARDTSKRPVETTVDTSIIPLPEPNPESVMEYVTKITFANKALSREVEKAQAKVQDMSEKMQALRAELEQLQEAKQEAQWAEVVDQIAAMREEG